MKISRGIGTAVKNHSSFPLPFFSPSQSTSAIQLKFDTIAIPFHISSSEIDTGYNSSKFNSPDVADTEK